MGVGVLTGILQVLTGQTVCEHLATGLVVEGFAGGRLPTARLKERLGARLVDEVGVEQRHTGQGSHDGVAPCLKLCAAHVNA